ncbi:DEDD exonuclease domain-containing protein [Nocardioidaceae bacterium]|nr:DEDD exonuclease domain-containing protein [Nocardioidaceae bacterium]
MSTTAPTRTPSWGQQRSFDELGRPLRETTFCVVDLETTGGSAAKGAMITEIGAVKVRGGEVLGELQSLVDPGEPIPRFISVLTGITDEMVATAPTIEQVLPAFLEFAQGCVLVAHNAPFDVGFLKHFAGVQQLPWPAFEVLDTAKLARRVLHRDETPNCKLSTLAGYFGAKTTPNHRALSDARATVDVLHGMLDRLGGLGVHTMEELSTFSAKVSAAQRRKRHLAEHLPHAPGVYLFRDTRDEVLYVGTSKDLRTRVRSYFTASETRSRMGEMVAVASRVDHVECATALEAEVRELRLIGAHEPRYNRRSRRPTKVTWLKLTDEAWPRLSYVRTVAEDGGTYLGPFRNRRAAEAVAGSLHETFPIRQCTGRLARRPSGSACVLAEMGRCLSPCDGSTSPEAYAEVVDGVRTALAASGDAVVERLTHRMRDLAAEERFEDAAAQRDRLFAFVRATSRAQRLVALTRLPELVGARREADGAWQVHVVRHGRLCAAGVMRGAVDATVWVDDLRASAETVRPGPGPTPAATAEESERLLRWLEQEGVRLVSVDGDWTSPVTGGGRHLASLDAAAASKEQLVPFDERRRLPVAHQPAR